MSSLLPEISRRSFIAYFGAASVSTALPSRSFSALAPEPAGVRAGTLSWYSQPQIELLSGQHVRMANAAGIFNLPGRSPMENGLAGPRVPDPPAPRTPQPETFSDDLIKTLSGRHIRRTPEPNFQPK